MVHLSALKMQKRFKVEVILNEVNGDYSKPLENRNVKKYVAVYSFKFLIGRKKVGIAILDVDPNTEQVIWHKFICNSDKKVAALCHIQALLELREIRPDVVDFDVLLKENESLKRKTMISAMELKREMQFNQHTQAALIYAGKNGFNFPDVIIQDSSFKKIKRKIKNALR